MLTTTIDKDVIDKKIQYFHSHLKDKRKDNIKSISFESASIYTDKFDDVSIKIYRFDDRLEATIFDDNEPIMTYEFEYEGIEMIDISTSEDCFYIHKQEGGLEYIMIHRED